MMFPDKFDGKIDWEEFITHFTAVSAWNGWSEGDKTIQLGLSMTGRARSVYTGLPTEVKVDFKALVNVLGKHFGSGGKEAAYKAAFRQRQRVVGENLQDFGDDLMRISKKAYPMIEFGAREEVVMEQFKQGLELSLRKHVQFTHPISLDEAVMAGLEFEAIEEGNAEQKASKCNAGGDYSRTR